MNKEISLKEIQNILTKQMFKDIIKEIEKSYGNFNNNEFKDWLLQGRDQLLKELNRKSSLLTVTKLIEFYYSYGDKKPLTSKYKTKRMLKIELSSKVMKILKGKK